MSSVGNLEMLQTIYAMLHPSEVVVNFQKAAENGDVTKVQEIIRTKFSEINSIRLGKAFLSAADNGHEKVVQAIINSVRLKDVPLPELGDAVKGLARKGCSKAVQALCDSPRFKDSSHNSPLSLSLAIAFVVAAQEGHENVVKVLSVPSRFKLIRPGLIKNHRDPKVAAAFLKVSRVARNAAFASSSSGLEWKRIPTEDVKESKSSPTEDVKESNRKRHKTE